MSGLSGWGLYAAGFVVLIADWPLSRPVGLLMIFLGLIDHGISVWRAWGRDETYEWKSD